MKVGSSDRIETIYRMGDLGLKFSHVPGPSAAPGPAQRPGADLFRDQPRAAAERMAVRGAIVDAGHPVQREQDRG